MTPAEIITALIDTGACYQVQAQPNLNSPTKEDYSQIGYNEEKIAPRDSPFEWQVVTDKKDLFKFNQWLLAMEKPDKVDRFNGPMLSCCILKRQLYFQGDDIPFGLEAMRLKFNCEHVRSIRMAEGTNVMLVETTFGQTGIMIPKNG